MSRFGEDAGNREQAFHADGAGTSGGAPDCSDRIPISSRPGYGVAWRSHRADGTHRSCGLPSCTLMPEGSPRRMLGPRKVGRNATKGRK